MGANGPGRSPRAILLFLLIAIAILLALTASGATGGPGTSGEGGSPPDPSGTGGSTVKAAPSASMSTSASTSTASAGGDDKDDPGVVFDPDAPLPAWINPADVDPPLAEIDDGIDSIEDADDTGDPAAENGADPEWIPNPGVPPENPNDPLELGIPSEQFHRSLIQYANRGYEPALRWLVFTVAIWNRLPAEYQQHLFANLADFNPRIPPKLLADAQLMASVQTIVMWRAGAVASPPVGPVLAQTPTNTTIGTFRRLVDLLVGSDNLEVAAWRDVLRIARDPKDALNELAQWRLNADQPNWAAVRGNPIAEETRRLINGVAEPVYAPDDFTPLEGEDFDAHRERILARITELAGRIESDDAYRYGTPILERLLDEALSALIDCITSDPSLVTADHAHLLVEIAQGTRPELDRPEVRAAAMSALSLVDPSWFDDDDIAYLVDLAWSSNTDAVLRALQESLLADPRALDAIRRDLSNNPRAMIAAIGAGLELEKAELVTTLTAAIAIAADRDRPDYPFQRAIIGLSERYSSVWQALVGLAKTLPTESQRSFADSLAGTCMPVPVRLSFEAQVQKTLNEPASAYIAARRKSINGYDSSPTTHVLGTLESLAADIAAIPEVAALRTPARNSAITATALLAAARDRNAPQACPALPCRVSHATFTSIASMVRARGGAILRDNNQASVVYAPSDADPIIISGPIFLAIPGLAFTSGGVLVNTWASLMTDPVNAALARRSPGMAAFRSNMRAFDTETERAITGFTEMFTSMDNVMAQAKEQFRLTPTSFRLIESDLGGALNEVDRNSRLNERVVHRVPGNPELEAWLNDNVPLPNVTELVDSWRNLTYFRAVMGFPLQSVTRADLLTILQRLRTRLASLTVVRQCAEALVAGRAAPADCPATPGATTDDQKLNAYAEDYVGELTGLQNDVAAFPQLMQNFMAGTVQELTQTAVMAATLAVGVATCGMGLTAAILINGAVGAAGRVLLSYQAAALSNNLDRWNPVLDGTIGFVEGAMIPVAGRIGSAAGGMYAARVLGVGGAEGAVAVQINLRSGATLARIGTSWAIETLTTNAVLSANKLALDTVQGHPITMEALLQDLSWNTVLSIGMSSVHLGARVTRSLLARRGATGITEPMILDANARAREKLSLEQNATQAQTEARVRDLLSQRPGDIDTLLAYHQLALSNGWTVPADIPGIATIGAVDITAAFPPPGAGRCMDFAIANWIFDHPSVFGLAESRASLTSGRELLRGLNLGLNESNARIRTGRDQVAALNKFLASIGKPPIENPQILNSRAEVLSYLNHAERPTGNAVESYLVIGVGADPAVVGENANHAMYAWIDSAGYVRMVDTYYGRPHTVDSWAWSRYLVYRLP